ncbi:MAG: prepilin-type N-terminal cleavage/methylation domain-containing protein [Candidatus Cloacimonetes bacterium]|jgi:prepilin-type N-terminal cleavage/methylation domain-containing protein|nr:prepilin-type N-terminal cleavage/methylation domain-containing protein [Candidatus Cloacimonadota bacterium]HOA28775.1 prepilin-type N-terminal cleavage/methylation domain-containing protein [Candidatus Cloacimonadota bacterium]HOH60625.1 prepilin-type N-terminal cleavage/methylation domain-containing protein [Candidatus Cloacimonadota bacterium]
MTPRFLQDKPCLLTNERGVTLLELLVTAVILVVLILTVYIGIVFADRMSVRNYRDRVATLLVSGELDCQYFINKFNNYGSQDYFKTFKSRDVVIDHIKKKDLLMGKLSVTAVPEIEYNGLQQYKFVKLIARVEWQDPYDRKLKYVQMREDYYMSLGGETP